MNIKGKIKGKQFEQRVRNFLRRYNFFVIPKGISTYGIDIYSFRDNIALFLELKSFKKENKSLIKKATEQYLKQEEVIREFKKKVNCFREVYHYLIIYIREKKVFYVYNKNLEKKVFLKLDNSLLNYLLS